MSNTKEENVGWVSDSVTQQILNDFDTNNILEDIHPITWIKVTIGQIANVQSGVGFPISYQGKSEEIYPVYKVGDISRSIINAKGILAVAENTVSETDAAKLKGAIFPIGTTLFAKIGEAVRLNRRAYVVKPGLADNNVMGVKPFFQETDKFIYFFMKTVDLNEASRSTTVPSIRKSDIEDLSLYLPPLSEQHQIAAKLDELLAQVDSIKTRLDAIPSILKRFRQSVLAAAVSGNLTKELRKKNNCPHWKSTKLSDLANILDPHPSHRTPKEAQGGIPYISIGDLKDDGTIDFEHARKVSSDILFEHKNRYKLECGDFVFGKIGTLGKATALPINVEYTLSANVILIQPNKGVTIPKYLMYFLSSPSTMADIAKQANSTSQAAFGIKKMREFICEIPSIEEQTEIVRRVEQLFSYADQIEQRVKDAQARVNHLIQAILAKAFRGELTADWRAQNPDLISGENSAEALLAKIQTERSHVNTGKSSQRRRSV